MLNIETLLKKIQQFDTTTEDIISYMHLIFSSIMQIIYNFILKTVDIFEKRRSEINTKNVKYNNTHLITMYEDLISQSILMKFPSVFIKNVTLILRIIKDISFYKRIFDSTIIRNTISKRLNHLQNKNWKDLSLLNEKNESEFKFLNFLEVLTSIDEFKYFNLILSSQQTDYLEHDLADTGLNKINILKGNNEECKQIQTLYPYCFKIQSKIENCKFKIFCLNNLQKEFHVLIQKVLDIKPRKTSNENKDFITTITSITNYLTNNIERNNSFNKEKLNRTIRFIMNLIDRYQINNCENPKYRDSFVNNSHQITDVFVKNNGNEIKADKTSVTIPSNEKHNTREITATLIKNFINSSSNQLYHPKFYWRGELKTINEITNSIDKNLLNFSSFTNYIYLFHKWFISMLMYTIIDVLKCLSRNNYVMDYDKTLAAYVIELSKINFPEPYKTVINVDVVDNFYRPNNVIGLQILLEEYLEEFNVIIQTTTHPLRDIATSMKHLDDIFCNIKEFYNEKEKPKTSNKFNLFKIKKKNESKTKTENYNLFIKIPNEE